ncbi:hypothetical protein K7X08_033624 [Anisodus acutangulus]|uniref:Uncharacterized protein n=1 Tax=Anisodus acutangulus TaxID=402998 RepID=A0A9Q1RDE7_9SOLA|nr:hypothetical protein K7X08_033624 [Anisodus acutangulus]
MKRPRAPSDMKTRKDAISARRGQLDIILQYDDDQLEGYHKLMAADVSSRDGEVQLKATKELGRLFSDDGDIPFTAIIKSGVASQVVKFLDAGHSEQLQLEAATALIVCRGIHLWLLRLSWHLGILLVAIMIAVIMFFSMRTKENDELSMQSSTAWTLLMFYKDKLQPAFELVKPALTALRTLVYSNDEEVLINACTFLQASVLFSIHACPSCNWTLFSVRAS